MVQTWYFSAVAVSIILSTSPRFSEVLFSRGRHSQKTDVYVNKVLGHSVFLF